MSSDLPEGFRPIPFQDPFNTHVGTIHEKGTAPEKTYALPLAPHHANLNGVLHGGVMFSFADAIMGLTLEEEAKRLTATISLNVEFVGNRSPGGWLEGRPQLVRLARTVAFLRSDILSDGRLLMTASGVWRVFDQASDRFT